MCRHSLGNLKAPHALYLKSEPEILIIFYIRGSNYHYCKYNGFVSSDLIFTRYEFTAANKNLLPVKHKPHLNILNIKKISSYLKKKVSIRNTD
jgi:hypothetical protein